jgi:hypothetical protein
MRLDDITLQKQREAWLKDTENRIKKAQRSATCDEITTTPIAGRGILYKTTCKLGPILTNQADPYGETVDEETAKSKRKALQGHRRIMNRTVKADLTLAAIGICYYNRTLDNKPLEYTPNSLNFNFETEDLTKLYPKMIRNVNWQCSYLDHYQDEADLQTVPAATRPATRRRQQNSNDSIWSRAATFFLPLLQRLLR